MPQMFAYLIAAALLIVVAFLAFYVFLALLVIGIGMYAFVWVRRWLIQKGILTPRTESSPFDTVFVRTKRNPHTTKVTVIEAEFETMEPPPVSSEPPERD